MSDATILAVFMTALAIAGVMATGAYDRRRSGWTASAEAPAPAPACSHRDFIDVEESVTGDVVARLCRGCDEQLDAGFWPAGGRINTPPRREIDMTDPVAQWALDPATDRLSFNAWSSTAPIRQRDYRVPREIEYVEVYDAAMLIERRVAVPRF